MFRYEAAIVVLSPEAQSRLLPVLRDDHRLQQWNTRAYSMVDPWSTRYQQSNQWLLETLAGAMDEHAATRGQAQAWLRLHDYRPTTLHIDPLTRLGAEVTKANIAFDDHPNEKRFSDRIETATVDSALAWFSASHIGREPIYVR